MLQPNKTKYIYYWTTLFPYKTSVEVFHFKILSNGVGVTFLEAEPDVALDDLIFILQFTRVNLETRK